MEHTQDNTIHVRLTPDLAAQLRRLAADQERPLSSLVRRMLRAEAARQASEKAA
jgi:hypothetical protein